MIQTLFSLQQNPELPVELERMINLPRRKPFDSKTIAFVAAVSARILKSDMAQKYPELAALAHWFRVASLKDMEKRSATGWESVHIRPRGIVFALAPANVDVLFIYGWFLSLLCGNATVVRVSRKSSELRDVFLELVTDVASEQTYHSVLNDSWIITYEHDNQLTATFSAVADARLIWGGDSSIAEIRKVFLNPLAVEVVFADRFSLAVFSADVILKESEKNLTETARRFANDTLWFSQQACSSPKAVFWVGTDDQISKAAAKFWPPYRQAAKSFENEPAAVLTRVSDMFSLVAMGLVDSVASPISLVPGLCASSHAAKELREIHSGYGLFVEYRITALEQLADYLEDKDQTLVAHGFSHADLVRIVINLPNRAIDRICKPGQATDFDTVWDGTDLLQTLLRKVRLTAPKQASDSQEN